MTVLLYALVMECVSQVSVCVIWSGKELTVIFTIQVHVRIIVAIEEYAGMEDVFVILDSVETSVKSVRPVLIIVTIGEYAGMESVIVSIIIWDLLVPLTLSRISKTNSKYNPHPFLSKHKEKAVVVLMIATIEECVFKILVSVKKVISVMIVNL